MIQVEDVCRVGKQGLPAASPTSVLEEDSWFSWESSSLSRQASPLRPSSMSSPMQLTSTQGVEGNGNNSACTRSLVETLQNCLSSLPQSTNMGDSAGRSLSDSTTTSSRQCSSRPPSKRRPRVSRRTPTTILEINPNEFLDMVQKLTGIARATPAAAPVRPHPQRASPTNLVRPETLRSIRRLPPISSPARPLLTPSPTAFLRHLQRNHTPGGLYAPMAGAQCPVKREFPEESSSSPYESVMKRAMSAPTTSMESWWSDNDNSYGPNSLGPQFPLSTGDALTNAILSAASGTTASPDFAGLDSADGQLAQEEQDLFFSQMEIESWLSAQDHTSAESMRG